MRGRKCRILGAMSSSPAFQASLQFDHRESKRGKIGRLFEDNLGKRFFSARLHNTFGSSFRARVSEINADPLSPITIFNEYHFDAEANAEVSCYWAELRGRHLDLG